MKKEYILPLILVLLILPTLLFLRINIFKPEQPIRQVVVSPTETVSIEPTLENTTWEWVETRNADSTLTKPKDPSQFRMTLAKDMFYSSTDCNTIRGSYIVDEEVLSFGPLAATKMFCEQSDEQLYTVSFPLIASYRIENSYLYLILIKDLGEMKFAAVN